MNREWYGYRTNFKISTEKKLSTFYLDLIEENRTKSSGQDSTYSRTSVSGEVRGGTPGQEVESTGKKGKVRKRGRISKRKELVDEKVNK